jgi:hypothetical protein
MRIFFKLVVSHVQLCSIERLYSGRGADQCTSLDLLTELMDFVPPELCPYMVVLDLCPLVGCGSAYIWCNVSTARQKDREVI